MNIKPIKILLIEDNPGDIELIRAGFEEARIANEFQVISDGEQGLNFIKEGKNLPDVILLDINLPKIDGFEILDAIRDGELTNSIPVIMLTSSEADQDIVRSYRHHANSDVTKPVDFHKFLETIQEMEKFWLSVVKLP